MRQITVKYQGSCIKCGKSLEVGTQAMYEKNMGIFCVGCEPTEPEEIRKFRQIKADKKADKYETWATKREKDAQDRLNRFGSVRHDWAFVTQPGHIPYREKMNKSDDIAFESMNKAQEMREKAKNLRHVRVAGDAERKRQAHREKLDTIIHKGSRVESIFFGPGEVVGIYKKSYRIKFDSGVTHAEEKTFIIPLT